MVLHSQTATKGVMYKTIQVGGCREGLTGGWWSDPPPQQWRAECHTHFTHTPSTVSQHAMAPALPTHMVRDAQLHKRSCSRNGSSSDPQGISSSPAAAGAKQESEPHRPATRDASLRPCVPKDKSPGWGLLAKNAAKGRGDDDAQYHAANDDHDLLLLGRGGGGGRKRNQQQGSITAMPGGPEHAKNATISPSPVWLQELEFWGLWVWLEW